MLANNKFKTSALVGLLAVALMSCDRIENIVYENPLHFNVVSLTETASSVTENDVLNINLKIETNNPLRNNAVNDLTAKLNRTMAAIKSNPKIEAQLTNRSGYERQERDAINPKKYNKFWYEYAEIKLTSKEFTAVHELVAKVQADAGVVGMYYTLSDEKRSAIETQLAEKGIELFTQKANSISSKLGGKGYKIISLNIGNTATPQPVYRNMLLAKSAASDESFASVDDDLQGKNKVSLQISGSIQVEK